MSQPPTRSWYARRRPGLRYQVLCRHASGLEQDCGTTMAAASPEDGFDQVMEWLAEHARHGEPIVFNNAEVLS
jgi:hypothetical protein